MGNGSIERHAGMGSPGARAVRAPGAFAALAALLVVALPARAQEPARSYHEFEITPFLGYMAGGEFEDPVDGTGRDLDADLAWGVVLDAAADPWRHYELLYVQQGTQLDGVENIDIDVRYLQIGGTVSYPDAQRFIPYFGLTVGAAQFSPGRAGLDDETNFAFSVAGGLRVPVTERIGLRFDARAFVTLLDTDGNIFCVSSEGATCRIRAKSDTFLQYAASLGVSVGF